jgi:hypothetical protein
MLHNSIKVPRQYAKHCQGSTMVVLNFTLTPEAASKIHDLLICLGKFSDTVAIEARRERVGLHHCPL